MINSCVLGYFQAQFNAHAHCDFSVQEEASGFLEVFWASGVCEAGSINGRQIKAFLPFTGKQKKEHPSLYLDCSSFTSFKSFRV